ncbi:energy transducer TonB [Pseudogulbenkiania sp. MAI-1]|uniref:energy transducer TonB n=1 Tax=Pseudogulbenkiania sp. MAI-1 TaxID=990370 RepID=UPI0004B38D3E|nr:energy transducer TonB [Pseudogulbenkiania sp. MAI-1]
MLALSLSLALHAAALLLPGPPPRAASVPGMLSVLLSPSPSSGRLFPEGRFSSSEVPLPSLSGLSVQAHSHEYGTGDEPRRVPAAVVASEPLAATADASAPLTMQPASALPGTEAGGYFPATALDVPAQPLQPIVFTLPPDAPAGEARLMVRVYINEQGGVDAVEPEQPDPSGVLEREALRVFLPIRFAPAQRHGLAVKSYKRIEVRMQN